MLLIRPTNLYGTLVLALALYQVFALLLLALKAVVLIIPSLTIENVDVKLIMANSTVPALLMAARAKSDTTPFVVPSVAPLGTVNDKAVLTIRLVREPLLAVALLKVIGVRCKVAVNALAAIEGRRSRKT